MRTSDGAAAGPPCGLRVLVIEDDEPVARTFVRGIERAGLQAAWASTGGLGMALASSFRPHVVLAGLWLPDMNGLTLIGQLIGRRDCGVIVVSGSGDDADRVVSLKLGADDYIAKPTSMREMIACIHAVHRRINLAGLPDRQGTSIPAVQVLEAGPILIDVHRRVAHTLDGQRLALTSAEFIALEQLARAAGDPVSRGKLSEAALRRPWRPGDRSLDQLIFTLHQKLPAGRDGSRLIRSVRGSGYSLHVPDGIAPVQARRAVAK